ncbi:MAG: hypothetical protein ABII18_07650 [bacterium]|nr:hypothetical protein [bacterium]MBU1917296.1 hypothetical protein [bacterium]
MSLSIINSGASQGVNIESILAETQQSYSDQKKDARMMRDAHFQGRMTMLDNNIDKLKESKKQSEKAGLFNTLVSTIGGLLSQASQLLNAWMPGLGSAVSSALKVITNIMQSQNPYKKKASQAQIDSEEYKKMAEYEGNRSQIYADDVANTRSYQDQEAQHLNKAIDNVMAARSVSVD